MPRRNLLSLCLFALMTLVSTAGPANAAKFWEKGFWLKGPRYDSKVSPCDAFLEEIAQNFVTKEARFWNSKLYITGFTDVREIAFRPWQSGNIPRRYCTAQVAISDGKVRTMNFSIIEDGGFASIGDGVEFCIVGLDRNWAFNPACRMARP
jgi:hypothetical protein